jgi:hypothetical protein
MRFTLLVGAAVWAEALDEVEFRDEGGELEAGGGAGSATAEGKLSLCLWLVWVGKEVLKGADVGIMGGIRRASSSTGMLLNGAVCTALLWLFVVPVDVAASKPNRKRRSDTRRRTGEEETVPLLLEPAERFPSDTGGADWKTVPNEGNPRSIR